MAYPPRQFHSGYWYHVFTHHQRDGVLFHSDEDRRQFLQYLDQTLSRQKAFLGAFCLMDTHYHSLIRMGEVDLGRIFQTVHMRYAQYFNQTHDEQGNLFHRRPGMKIVLNDDYLLQLVPYIHQNPILAGMVDQPQDYPWHSDGRYRGTESVYDWTAWQFAPGFTGEDRVRVYRERMNETVNPEEWEGGEVYIGSEESWESLERRSEKRSDRKRGERRGRPSMESLAEEIAEKAGMTVEELQAPGRGRERSRVRQNAMVEMYREGYGPTEIGRFFNRSKSAVTYAVQKYQD